MTPAELAVLSDCLREVLDEKDAADVARWAAHPEAVRELLKHTPWRLPEDRDYENDSPNCAGCTAVSVWNDADDAHARYCGVADAWRALGDPRGAADVERAWEEALREGRERAVREADAVARAQGREFGISAEQAARIRGEYPATGGWVNESDAEFIAAHIGQPSILGTALNSAPRGGLVNVTLGGLPVDRERTPLLFRLSSHQSRTASDARGMEAVEDEARAVEADIERGVFPPDLAVWLRADNRAP